MQISILTAEENIRRAPERWSDQYDHLVGDSWEPYQEKSRELAALVWPFTKEDVERIIGNKSWTTLTCDICNNEAHSLLNLEIDPSYGLCACRSCLEMWSKRIPTLR